MEKVKKYRKVVMDTLEAYHKSGVTPSHVEEQVIFDTKNDHYQIKAVGWNGDRRIFFCIHQMDIKDGKIWVQENSTDFDIVLELEKKGVPKSDIVLAFHAPSMRKYTGYAVA